MDAWRDIPPNFMKLRPNSAAGRAFAVAHGLIDSPTVAKPDRGVSLEEASRDMTDLSAERRTPREPEEAPETPPDEPKPTPVQDPPAEPNPSPYVVSTDHPGQRERE